MIGKISRGRTMFGLINYIVGPGKSDEHRSPDIIAGSGLLAQAFARRSDSETWSKLDIWAVSRQLDRHFRARLELDHHDTRGKDKPSRSQVSDQHPPHVYHVSLSLNPTDGVQPRERWAELAGEYIRRMGFARCEWAAWRHGASVGGNDHIHLTINLVQRDGSWANVHGDFARNGRVCRTLERDYGLQVVRQQREPSADRDRDHGVERGLPGYEPGEEARQSSPAMEKDAARRLLNQAQQDRNVSFIGVTSAPDGKVRITTRHEPQRVTLERLARIAATAAGSESEFVQNLRGMGVWTRPRYGEGGRAKVVGYSLSMPPWPGRERIWFGGGRLASDLTLPQLRKRWPDDGQEEATTRWAGQASASDTEHAEQTSEQAKRWGEQQQKDWERRLIAHLQQAERDWRSLHGEDARRSAASDTAALLGAAAWQMRDRNLADAAREFARNAQGYDDQARPRIHTHPSIASAVRLMVRAAGPYPITGWVAVLRQLGRLAEATAEAHQAEGELIQAQRATRAVQDRVNLVMATLSGAAGVLTTEEVDELRAAGQSSALATGDGEQAVRRRESPTSTPTPAREQGRTRRPEGS